MTLAASSTPAGSGQSAQVCEHCERPTLVQITQVCLTSRASGPRSVRTALVFTFCDAASLMLQWLTPYLSAKLHLRLCANITGAVVAAILY